MYINAKLFNKLLKILILINNLLSMNRVCFIDIIIFVKFYVKNKQKQSRCVVYQIRAIKGDVFIRCLPINLLIN